MYGQAPLTRSDGLRFVLTIGAYHRNNDPLCLGKKIMTKDESEAIEIYKHAANCNSIVSHIGFAFQVVGVTFVFDLFFGRVCHCRAKSVRFPISATKFA